MHSARIAFISCAGLLILFACVSWSATSSKSPAYDEPYHAISAWLQLRHRDFRMDNEDPPLWQYWASLPNGSSALSADFNSPFWKLMPDNITYQWYWGVRTLYRTPGNDPVKFIRNCRAMMLIIALILGAAIARWAWQIGGTVAAVAATAIFALDPNFIAHASLMKNDVAFSLSMFLLAWALWRAGQKLTGSGIVSIAVFSVVTLTTKFSGVGAVMLVPAMLGLRVIRPTPWPVLGRSINTRSKRLAVAFAVLMFTAMMSCAGIWAVYGFRFRPSTEPGVWLGLQESATRAGQNAIVARYGDIPPDGVPAHPDPGSVAKTVLFANDHGLLPQPYLAGFLFTYANGLIRSTFLCGQISWVGRWWYFPFAMLVKTPVVTILAAGITAIAAMRAIVRRRFFKSDSGWTALCLAVPFAIYLTSAMLNNLNIGLRHVLPIYPFAFVTIGWAVSIAWRKRNIAIRSIVVGAGFLLAFESLWAYPDFIPYFNVISRNVDGGPIAMLSDSNLDWGQDLPLLAAWQRAHPDVPLYLSYFGYADPAYYHIRYHPLPGGYNYDPPPQFPKPYERCVVAVSATNLQGTLVPAGLQPYYQQLRRIKPKAVLGGSIYLFEFD